MGVSTSSSAARLGSFAASYVVWLVSLTILAQLGISLSHGQFFAMFGVLPRPPLRVSAPRKVTFSIIVVCTMVNLQLQLFMFE
jgi:hypothetical protein